MNFAGHVIAGFAATAVFFAGLNAVGLFSAAEFSKPALLLQAAAAVAVFSILPDVDSSSSTASRIFRVVVAVVLAASAVDYASSKNSAALERMVVAAAVLALHFAYARRGRFHRRLPHSIAFGLLASAALYAATGSAWVCLAGAVAFCSHLAADRL